MGEASRECAGGVSHGGLEMPGWGVLGSILKAGEIAAHPFHSLHQLQMVSKGPEATSQPFTRPNPLVISFLERLIISPLRVRCSLSR